MATGLLALLDDVISVLDDVAVLSKKAASKTTGVLGDDLALNAEQLTGCAAERELPIIWKVFKGSLINKLILVPVALVISYLMPSLIVPLLMIGGAYLCYEGTEKVIDVVEKFLNKKNNISELRSVPTDSEEQKIKGAIKTDFVLSAEIIVITLGTLTGQDITKQIMTLSLIAFLMTLGVYGFVAIIIKMDDVGFYLAKKQGLIQKNVGVFLAASAPKLLKVLGFVGTVAMFMVGGEILTHGVHLNQILKYPEWSNIPVNIAVGLALGGLLVGLHHLYEMVKNKKKKEYV